MSGEPVAAVNWTPVGGGSSMILPRYGGTGLNTSALTGIPELRVGTWYFPQNHINVQTYGAKGDGVTDDTAEIQAAIDAAVAGHIGTVYFPAGEYLITSTLNINGPITLCGAGASGNSPNDNMSVLVHAFNGTFLAFNGSTSGATSDNSGGGWRDILLANKFGAPGSANGAAVALVNQSALQWPNTIRARDFGIERYSTAYGEWTYGIYADGEANGGSDNIRGLWIDNPRITVDTGATAAISLSRIFNVYITNPMLNLAKADLIITGSAGHLSSNVLVLGGGGTGLVLDYAETVRVNGGAWSTVTDTANTLTSFIFPCQLTTAPTIIGNNVLVATQDATNGHFLVSSKNGTFMVRENGAVSVGSPGSVSGLVGDVILPNAKQLRGSNAGGTDTITLIGASADNFVHLDPGQAGIKFGLPLVSLGGGSAPTVGTIGGSGPASAGQDSWMKMYDSTGAAIFIPVWK